MLSLRWSLTDNTHDDKGNTKGNHFFRYNVSKRIKSRVHYSTYDQATPDMGSTIRDVTAARSNPTRLSQAIVFSTLAVLGGGLVALVTLGGVDWVIPTVGYGTVAYLAWRQFF